MHPVNPEGKRAALQEAGNSPSIFNDIKEHFSDGPPSAEALKSWLTREEFLDRAINPVSKAYLGTVQYLEQEKAFESGGPSSDLGDKTEGNEDDSGETHTIFGGAKVGDFVQWEIDGILQMEEPMRVRLVDTIEGRTFVAVDGHETGIPMEQVIVEESAKVETALPQFALKAKSENEGEQEADALPEGWREERLIDDSGEVTLIRYKGDPSQDRYTYIRDYYDFKLNRMAKANVG